MKLADKIIIRDRPDYCMSILNNDVSTLNIDQSKVGMGEIVAVGEIVNTNKPGYFRKGDMVFYNKDDGINLIRGDGDMSEKVIAIKESHYIEKARVGHDIIQVEHDIIKEDFPKLDTIGFNPKWGEIFVRPLPLDEKISGVTIFNKLRGTTNQLMMGKVFAIADELKNEKDSVYQAGLKIDDIVIYKEADIELEINGKPASILKGCDILGTIKQ